MKLENQIKTKLYLFSLKNSAIKNAPWFMIVLFLLLSIFLIRPIIAGYYEETNVYNQTLSLKINESGQEQIILGHNGILKSLKITGEVSTQGIVEVYLRDNDNYYLIFNRTNFITNTNNQNQSNDSRIAIKLDYKAGTEWDKDNDGIETTAGVIDFTIKNSIINNLSYNKLCTKWETYSIDNNEITTICNGNEKCCNFISLTPTSELWNDTFLLNYGKYGAAYNNIISAQILYVDYNTSLENPYAEINNSQWQSLNAIFYEEFTSFKDICIDTCTINLNTSLPVLVFNLTNATINIDYTTYGITELVENITENITNITETNTTLEINETLTQGFAEIGKPVKWKRTIKLNKNTSNLTINLTRYATNIKITDDKKQEINATEKTRGFQSQSSKDKQIIIEQEIKEIEIEYETPGPVKTEEIINQNKKKIIISSDIHYENILTYTTLETEAENIRLYWVNQEQEISFTAYDNNNNNLIDYIEWTIPHLSDQEFIVETVSVAGDDTNLTIWDTTDTLLKNINEPIYFYANFTNQTTKGSINGSNINCSFSENSTGSWSNILNMSFNTTTAIYEYNKSFSQVNVSYYNISCTIEQLQTLSTIDSFQVGWINITITLSDYNITTNKNMTISGHINKSDGSNVSDYNISIYLGEDKLYYDNINKILTTTASAYSPNTTIYGDYAYNFTSHSEDGTYKLTVNLTYSGISASFNISFVVNSTPPTINLDLPTNGTAQRDGNVTFKYTPYATGMDTCILYGDFSGTWQANETQTSVTSDSQQTIYLNLTNGTYIWNVWCNNSLGNAAFNATNYTITVDTVKPSVILKNPINNTNTSSTFMNFNWTVTDNLDPELMCNLTINSTVNISYIPSPNGTATDRTVSGFADGDYSWNVTCIDNATNQNTSIINLFTIDTTGPVITLDLPSNGTAQRDGNVTFKYTPYDGLLDSCTLYGDFSGTWQANETQTSVTSDSQQTIYLNLTNGTYIWNVWCNDTLGNTAFNATNYTIIIDTIEPQVSLIFPENNSWSNSQTVTFNYTLNENNPDTCSLYVNISGGWSAIANYTSPINGSNNFTITLSDGVYIWNVWCNDSVALSSMNETNLTLRIDTQAPIITNETRAPDPSYYNNTVILNATIEDNRSLNITWIEGNWTGDWQNYTSSITNQSSNYLYTVNEADFSNQEVIGWRFWANDSAGNTRQGALQSFKVENIALPEQPNLTSPGNNTIQVYNKIDFIWVKPFDKDNDNLSYQILVANDSAFTKIELNKSDINATSYNLSAAGDGLTSGIKYWKVRAKDPANYSNYSTNYIIRYVVDSIINISSLANRTIVYPGNITNISVTEIRSGDWVNNVTLTIDGTNYTLKGDPTWNLTYTIPPGPPRFINITATAFNITTNLTISDYIQLRVSKINASSPEIKTACSNETYAINNTNLILSVNAKLDTLIEMINFTITTPSDEETVLNEYSSANINLTYTYYYYYKIQETGNYTIKADIKDIENKNISLNYTFFSYSNDSLTSINLTATGVSSMSLDDICSGNAIHEGTTNIVASIINESKYNLKFTTADPTITFNNFRANGTILNALNYTNLAKSIAAPSGKRAIIEFELTSNMTTMPVYDNITISYNYSAIESALDDETGLKIYKCKSQSSCSWTELTATLNTTTNIISVKVTNLSVFLVAETAETVRIVTQTVSGGRGGGGATIQNVSQITSLEIKSAGPMLVEQEGVITAPITITNNGKVYLSKINLSVVSNSSEMTPSLSDDYIDALNLGESANITLTVNAKQKPGRYKITLYGTVEMPPYETSLDIYIDMVEEGYFNKKEIITRIQFAHDLFRENPECLELDEILKNAEIALNQTELEKATHLMESAVQACRDLVAAKEEGIFPSPKKSPEIYVFIIEMFVLIVLMIIMINYYRARRRRKYLRL